MTMAVGLIIHGDQAEQILRDGQADLIAVGREILNNPNWPMDAALKLGVEGAIPQRSAAIRLLAGHPRQARLWNPALDLAKRAAEGRLGDQIRSPHEPTGRTKRAPDDERNCARAVMTGSAICGYQRK